MPFWSKARHEGCGNNDSPTIAEAHKYRALFLSDIHLGTRGAQAGALLEFLKHHDAETIYLVGDIVDGWRLRQGWYWPQAHNDVVQKLLRKGRKGAQIVYVPGNHDEFLRDFSARISAASKCARRAIHEAADGKRYLVIHGDLFDVVVQHARWLAYLGDWAYAPRCGISMRVNWVRRRLGFTYWSLSAWAKHKVKNAVNFIGRFEEALVAEARKQRRRWRDLRPHPLRRDARHRTASPTSTPATGSKAARPSSSISTAAWKSSTGRCTARRSIANVRSPRRSSPSAPPSRMNQGERP